MKSVRRYSINDVYSNRFYQVPKFLFEGEFKKKLSADAKLLYALLKDRHELSIKNEWVNDKGEVYFYFTRADMADMLGCGRDKIIKLCNELKSFGLFEEVRQGLGKPNIIYLSYIDYQENHPKTTQKAFDNAEVGKSDFKTSENPTSGGLKNRLQDIGNLDSNNTDTKETDNSDTNLSYPIANTESDDEIDAIIKDNIEYEFCKKHKRNFDFIDSCYELIMEVMRSEEEFIVIAGSKKQIGVVKERFIKLRLEHLEYVQECFENNTTEVHNIKNYLLTSLFNAPVSIELYYQQKVNHDLSQ